MSQEIKWFVKFTENLVHYNGKCYYISGNSLSVEFSI